MHGGTMFFRTRKSGTRSYLQVVENRSYVGEIERVALVGEKAWQKWMAKIGGLLVARKVRYFDSADLTAAGQWVRG